MWDRCFGTYEPESEPVRYGLTGDKVVRTVGAALVGYPALLAKLRAETGWAPRLRVAALPRETSADATMPRRPGGANIIRAGDPFPC